MNVVVRAGTVADAAPLSELAARVFHDAFAADNRPEDMALHLAQAFGPFLQAKELADSNISTLLVEVDGELAGYAQVRSGAAPECITGDAPIELSRFYIAREWHGKGVAQTLMQAVMAEARRRNGRALWLGVWERNARAIAFYTRTGFVDVGSQVFMLGADAQTDRVLVIEVTSER